jgi:predicted Zn-dependent peptidase
VTRARQRLPLSLGAAALLAVCHGAAPGAAEAQRRIAVLEEPAATVVALALVLNAGSGGEMDWEAGIGHLAAAAVLESARPLLDALEAEAVVECDRGWLRFTLLAPPATWRSAAEVLLGAVFSPDFSPGAVERARAELLREVTARDGDPRQEAEVALQMARFGEESRWARPACGARESLLRLQPEAVRQLARTRFQPTRATAAVAGAVRGAEATRVLRAALGDVELPVLVPAPPRLAEPPGRVHVERNTVTAWLELAFPVHTEADPEALRLLGHWLAEAAAPGPARPAIYDVGATLEREGGRGGALRLTLVTSTDAPAAWATRLDSLAARAGEAASERERFEALLRRFRGARLLALATPEARARDAAHQLFYRGSYRAPAATLSVLDARALAQAAGALGAPAIATLGPAESALAATRR